MPAKQMKNEFVASFLWNDHPEKRIQTKLLSSWWTGMCVCGSREFNKHFVLKIFMINGQNFRTV